MATSFLPLMEILASAQAKEHRDLGFGSGKRCIEISASAQPREHRDLGSGSGKRASRSRLRLSKKSIEISAPAQPREHRDLGSAKKCIKISAPAQPKEYRDLGLKNSASGMSRLWLCRENFCLVKGRDHRKGKFLGEKPQTGWKNLPRKIGINTPSSPLFFVSSLHPRSIPFTQTKLYFC